jgi:hypothetical protein
MLAAEAWGEVGMLIELTQVEVNMIRLALRADPLVSPTTTDDGLSTGNLYARRVLLAILEKLPNRATTTEEREASYKEVGVTPNDQFTRAIRSGDGFQW